MVHPALAGLIGFSAWNDRRQTGWSPPVFKRTINLDQCGDAIGADKMFHSGCSRGVGNIPQP